MNHRHSETLARTLGITIACITAIILGFYAVAYVGESIVNAAQTVQKGRP